jgi:hypothetical protein
MGEATEEPAGRLWSRLRRPLGVLALVWITIRNFDGLTSGEPLRTVASAALVAFFAWLFLRPSPFVSLEGIPADQLRTRNRREMVSWGFWTLVAAAIMTWAGVENGFWPGALIVVAIPLLPVLLNAAMYAKADSVLAKVAERQEASRTGGGKEK